ncbi:MFS-type transporter SLC18B1-like isoform X2 [Patiria miniata]|uniref:Major facilitator superfamily (MFS) profile domain-containing protein n=1 Tax=Patiria miniata TaxID=46514 RepID=A0A913ZL61_PATMI|nr:MFS-type transporter SLC18B1-like isoform X2 [Patiria miniata]
MVEHSQSEESNLNTPPVVPNGNGHVTENNNQWQETSLEATPTNPINPAAASDGGSAAAPRSKFTLHQKITLLGAALTSFSTWSSYAVIAVFFPTVLPHFGARFVFLAGAFVTGGCIILLGFVVDMPTLATFTGFTFAIRTLEGLGTSACNTAVGAILTYTFMDDVGVATSLMETVVGTSFALAPVIGGLFYNMGGFKVPFFVLGGFVWACVAGNYFVMPKIGKTV